MKIVILGAGQFGASVAEILVSERNDVTIVDTDERRLRALQERLDLRAVLGDATLPSVLRAAQAGDAELLLAVTHSDHVNLCACRTAETLFNIPTKIALLRSPDYTEFPELLSANSFAVDRNICPEQVITDYIVRLIEFPEALQVLEFARGLVSLAAVRIATDGVLVGRRVADIRQYVPRAEVRIMAISRGDRTIVAEGHTVIEAGDELFCLAATQELHDVLRGLGGKESPCKRIMIAGGGNTGLRLAKATEAKYVVKLIELDSERVKDLAYRLGRTLLLQGDAADEALLANEGIRSMDFFLAMTDDEETNIVACLLAKKMGARRVLALINRGVYANLVQSDRIDIVVSPAQIALGALMTHVRRGDVAAVHTIRHGVAEALEVVVHGDAATSKVVGRRVEQLPLPKGVSIGAIVRPNQAANRGESGPQPSDAGGYQVLMAHRHTQIQSDDHVIVFLDDRKSVTPLEKLFEVGIFFI